MQAAIEQQRAQDASFQLSEAENAIIQRRIDAEVTEHHQAAGAAAQAEVQAWAGQRNGLRSAARDASVQLTADEEIEVLQRVRATHPATRYCHHGATAPYPSGHVQSNGFG